MTDYADSPLPRVSPMAGSTAVVRDVWKGRATPRPFFTQCFFVRQASHAGGLVQDTAFTDPTQLIRIPVPDSTRMAQFRTNNEVWVSFSSNSNVPQLLPVKNDSVMYGPDEIVGTYGPRLTNQILVLPNDPTFWDMAGTNTIAVSTATGEAIFNCLWFGV